MGKDVAGKSNKRCMVTAGKNSMQYEMRVTAEKKNSMNLGLKVSGT